ncbi:MAG: efflux RND transporter periplasmic adaptor subunit, partial [Bacteroidales bacterium]
MKRYSGVSLIGLRTASRGPGLRRDDNAFEGMTGQSTVVREGVPAFAGMTRSGSASRDGVPACAGMTTLLLAFVILFTGCKPAPVKEAVKVEPVKVRVAPVVIQEISLPVRSGGIVTTSEETKLSFKTGGIVARTYFKEGDAVKQGQLLAVLNLSEINAQVNQAKNGYDKALRDYNRAKNLYADSVATLEQMQNAETTMNVSKSVLDMSQFNQSHSRIMAPKSGVILRQLVKENELVAPGYPVYTLGISGKSWIIRTALSDRDIVKVNLGDSANVVIDAWPG